MSRGIGVSELTKRFLLDYSSTGRKGNVYYRYNNFYLYGEHYIMATKIPGLKFCWINADPYLVSTNNQRASFMAVARNLGWSYFMVDDCDPDNFHKNAVENVMSRIEKLPKARSNFPHIISNAKYYFRDYLAVCDMLDIVPEYESFFGAKDDAELVTAIAESDFKLKKKMVAMQLLNL